VELHRLEHVDDRGHQRLGQGEGGIVLRVAADLDHPLAELGKGHGQVRRGRALADAALAVDGKDLGLVDLHLGIEVHLQAALAVEAAAVPRIDWFTGMFTGVFMRPLLR
jgi:hypothetical protein